jgi:hypothetical protein
MNAKSIDMVVRDPIDGSGLFEKPSVDAAWSILEAANDLGDVQAVEACRRIIDASLRGASALQGDMHIVINYFR